MKGWSSSKGWQQEAAKYDEKLYDTTQEALVQKRARQLAEEEFDAEQAITTSFKMALYRAQEAITTAPVDTLADAERCVRLSKDLIELERSYRDSYMIHKCETRQKREEDANQLHEEWMKQLEQHYMQN